MKSARPSEEHPAAAEEVGERAGGEQQRGERQRVGVDDPLQVGEADESRSFAMSGSATFTIVMSSSSMNVATQTAPSVHQRRSVGVWSRARSCPSVYGDVARRWSRSRRRSRGSAMTRAISAGVTHAIVVGVGLRPRGWRACR